MTVTDFSKNKYGYWISNEKYLFSNEKVEFYYNGKSDIFLMFLSSVIRDYISEDPIAADEKTNTIRDLKGKARQVSDIRVLIKKHIDMQMPKERKHKIVKKDFLTTTEHTKERKMAA